MFRYLAGASEIAPCYFSVHAREMELFETADERGCTPMLGAAHRRAPAVPTLGGMLATCRCASDSPVQALAQVDFRIAGLRSDGSPRTDMSRDSTWGIARTARNQSSTT